MTKIIVHKFYEPFTTRFKPCFKLSIIFIDNNNKKMLRRQTR